MVVSVLKWKFYPEMALEVLFFSPLLSLILVLITLVAVAFVFVCLTRKRRDSDDYDGDYEVTIGQQPPPSPLAQPPPPGYAQPPAFAGYPQAASPVIQ